MERGVGSADSQQQESTSRGYRGLLSELIPGRRPREQLRIWRLCMVLVSFAPLFLLMAIRGNELVDDIWMWSACAALIILPLALLTLRVLSVWRSTATNPIHVGSVEDNRAHILAYLFATMLPFYRSSLDSWRDIIAICLALVLIVFLFWYLRLHYVNFILAVFDYRVFTIFPPDGGNRFSRRTALVLITRRNHLVLGDQLFAKRLSDTVYWETGL